MHSRQGEKAREPTKKSRLRVASLIGARNRGGGRLKRDSSLPTRGSFWWKNVEASSRSRSSCPSVYLLPLALVRPSLVPIMQSICSVFQVVLGIWLYWALLGILGTLLGFLFTYVFVDDRVEQTWDFLLFFERRVQNFSASFSSSELVSHQIPSRTTRARFLHTERLWSPTTPMGASGREHGLCLCPPLRLRGRTGVFRRRREGHLPATRLRVSPPASSRTSLAPVYEAIPHAEVRRLRARSRWVRFPFFFVYFFLVDLTFPLGYVFQGRRMWFPSAFLLVFGNRVLYVLVLVTCTTGTRGTGVGWPDVFPSRDCVQLLGTQFQGPL